MWTIESNKEGFGGDDQNWDKISTENAKHGVETSCEWYLTSLRKLASQQHSNLEGFCRTWWWRRINSSQFFPQKSESWFCFKSTNYVKGKTQHMKILLILSNCFGYLILLN